MRKSMARRGSLLLSVLAVVLSAALIAGATYALFSQRDSYDIEVSSGDIKVTGELAITGAWSQGENAAARAEGTEQEDGSYLVEQGGRVPDGRREDRDDEHLAGRRSDV